ncbi:nose resistant to fluoxetine protein 6 [Nephila pilipes]|uniref:Nose resistant to fluoxetine protein 6 n=1 Tax=Nephila pilipes TaxID=299642 RepID=A0A8X6NZ45_NEPPI|nr:nose resistant to fluoxetine protein 6 [Nephila pilipes]
MEVVKSHSRLNLANTMGREGFPTSESLNNGSQTRPFVLKRCHDGGTGHLIARVPLTPAYMMILGIHATLRIYTGSGPLWPTYDTEPRCRANWWMNLLYINNFISVYDQCMIWSWYNAVDMQLFVLSPLFIIPLIRKPRLGYALIGVFIFLSCFIIFSLTIVYCLKVLGAESQYFFSHREQFIHWGILSQDKKKKSIILIFSADKLGAAFYPSNYTYMQLTLQVFNVKSEKSSSLPLLPAKAANDRDETFPLVDRPGYAGDCEQ